jgi:hypothetical protein
MLSERKEYIAKEIDDCAFKVYKQSGPRLLEKFTKYAFVRNLVKSVIHKAS